MAENLDSQEETENIEVTALEQIFQARLVEPGIRAFAHQAALPRARLVCNDKVDEIKEEWLDGEANLFPGVYACAAPISYVSKNGSTCIVRLYVREITDKSKDIDSRSMIGVYVQSEVFEEPLLELRPDKLFRNGVGAHTSPDHLEDLRSLFCIMELYDGIEVTASSNELSDMTV
ncbi:MAG TPA: hypothetical protein VMR34_04955 [Candidatus Saccharimonadales bacterium]|nr:hypothetical protein [Candidatus Saccharimonadales bacterium]